MGGGWGGWYGTVPKCLRCRSSGLLAARLAEKVIPGGVKLAMAQVQTSSGDAMVALLGAHRAQACPAKASQAEERWELHESEMDKQVRELDMTLTHTQPPLQVDLLKVDRPPGANF